MWRAPPPLHICHLNGIGVSICQYLPKGSIRKHKNPQWQCELYAFKKVDFWQGWIDLRLRSWRWFIYLFGSKCEVYRYSTASQSQHHVILNNFSFNPEYMSHCFKTRWEMMTNWSWAVLFQNKKKSTPPKKKMVVQKHLIWLWQGECTHILRVLGTKRENDQISHSR